MLERIQLLKNYIWAPFFQYGSAIGREGDIEIEKEHVEIYKITKF